MISVQEVGSCCSTPDWIEFQARMMPCHIGDPCLTMGWLFIIQLECVSTKLYSHLFCLKINPRDLIKLNKDFNEVGDKGKLMAP